MLDTTEKINVVLVGAGGNGSAFFEALVRIDAALKAHDCPGLDVVVLDDDVIDDHNIVRQGFFAHEVGLHKAVALVHRANVCHGLSWQALPRRINEKDSSLVHWADLVVTAVDTASARRIVAGLAGKRNERWWLDMGVERSGGQVVLGQLAHCNVTDQFPNVIALYPEILTMEDSHSEPSCSAAESLSRQDLFANATAGLLAGNLLWQSLRQGVVEKNFVQFRLQSGQTHSGMSRLSV